MNKTVTKYHRIDRWIAAVLAVAFIASLTYLLIFVAPGKFRDGQMVGFMALALLFSAAVTVLLTVGVWRHRRWAFGWHAGLEAFSILSSVFFNVYEQVSGVQMPTTSTTILSWDDIYNLPISLYCAYRYLTFNQIENTPTD